MSIPKAYMQSGKQPGGLLNVKTFSENALEAEGNVQGLMVCICFFLSIFASFEVTAAVTKGSHSTDPYELSWCKN